MNRPVTHLTHLLHRLHAGLLSPPTTPGRGTRGERAQGTVEYALILLGAAAVALVVVAWVSRTDLIGRLFETVVGRILSQAE